MRSKIAFILCGALLVGGVSGALVAFSAAHHNPTTSTSGTGLTQASSTSPTATVTAAATATNTPSSNPSNNPNPTAVPTPTQPIRPSPTPTPPPVPGQPLDLHGTVGNNISSNTNPQYFVLNLVGGGTMTCDINVNGTTTWQGAATTFSALRSGMPAEVQGVYQSDGTLAASDVNTQPVDN